MNSELPSIREICQPRKDVLSGTVDRYTANLAQVIRGNAPEVYQDPIKFFENTYPTEGLKATIREVFSRLSKVGAGTPVIKLETSLGGGKTHALIALYHLAKHGSKIANSKFLGDLDFGQMKIAAVVGTDVQTTLWGDIAKQLRGEDGYKIVKQEVEEKTSPSETKFRKLFGEEKCLVLIDEIALYLAKASGLPVGNSTLAEQTIAFLQTLTQVAGSMDNVSLVITSLNKSDVFGRRTEELQKILDSDVKEAKASDAIRDADKVLSRMVHNLTPTRGEEFPFIIRHRLFKNINNTAGLEVCKAYHNSLNRDGVKEFMPKHATEAKYYSYFQESYPFHPEFISILRTKTASISNFNQTRGVLRLLSLMIKHLWDTKADTPLIHPYHVDFYESMFTNELISRLDRGEYVAAVAADIADTRGTPRASFVDENFSEPLGTRICTTIFLHSLTGAVGADIRRGANEAEIQLALHRPGLDPKTVEMALKDVEDRCFYLVKHGSMYAFNTEPNLNKLIDEATATVEATMVLRECEKRIEQIYGARRYFDPRIRANKPNDVPDDTGKPKLVIPHYNDCITSGGTTKTPELVEKIYLEAGTQGKPRIFSNNLLFLVADKDEREKMEIRAREYLALKKLCDDIEEGAPGLQALSPLQRDKLKEKRQESELFMKVAIILAHKHFFLPATQKSLDDVQAKKPLRKISARMTDTEVEKQIRSNASEEDAILNFLKDNEAVRTADDNPWAPDLVMEKFWPKNTDSITGDEFKKVFYKNPEARLIMAEDLILRAQQIGVKASKWYAVRGDQFYDKSNSAIFSPAFTPETQLILAETEAGKTGKLQFYCSKCGMRKTECQCHKEKCPNCGKTLDQCTCKTLLCRECGGPYSVCKGAHGPGIIPAIVEKTMSGIVGELLPVLEDKEVGEIKSLELKANGRNDLSRLVQAIPQFLGAKTFFNIKATLDEEFKGGNFFQITYKGEESGFRSIKQVLLNYEGKENFNTHDLKIIFTWDDGIKRDEFISILRDKIAQFTGDAIYTARITAREA